MSKAFLRDKAWRPFKEGLTEPAKYTVDPRLAWVYAESQISPLESTFDDPFGDAYIYGCDSVRLFNEEKSLRLLQILPDDFTAHISCTLGAYRLSDCPPYEALSYCWGDVTDGLSILLNGSVMRVTSNLRAALRHLRSSSTSRCLWVDAICINQADVAEQSAQVSIMGDIYRNAVQTTVWLGSASDNSHQGCTAVAGLSRAAKNSFIGDPGRELRSTEQAPFKESYMLKCMLPATSVDDSDGNAEVSLPDDSRALEALREAVGPLTDRPWFWRVWVVQEVALARTALIVCGFDTLTWIDYTSGIDFRIEIGVLETSIMGYVRDPHETYTNMIAPSEIITSTHRPADLLLSLLHKCRFREATNPVDKVYSLLGLVGNKVHELGIVPDYTLPFQQVYRDVAQSIVINSSDLDILGMTQPLKGSSWVPDWSLPTQAAPLTVKRLDTPSVTHASQHTAPELRISGHGDVLLLKGHTIDRIVEVAGHMDFMKDWFDDETDTLIPDYEPALAEVPDDAPFSQNVGALLREIPKASKWLGDTVHITFHELFRSLEPLERFVEWENLAKIHDTGSAHSRTDNMATYLEVLTAGNYLPGGPEATKLVFDEWLQTLSPIRKLLRVKSAIMKLYKPLAFAGYLRKTWQTYGKFHDVLDHVYNRRMGRTAKGKLALLPRSAATGDVIVVCKGSRVPLCVRPADEIMFTLLGEAYVHGVMNGEAFDEELCEAIPIR
ncbi:hypothetical protein LTR95_006824 [Oleoguttula sp. CCFEE 5521]